MARDAKLLRWLAAQARLTQRRLEALEGGCRPGEILATVRHDISVLEANLEELKAKIMGDNDQGVNALNGRSDYCGKVVLLDKSLLGLID